MLIVSLTADHAALIEEVAAMLMDAFGDLPSAYHTLDDARAEIMDSFDAERISRVALADDGSAVGWIGGIPEYDGHVWELHPLVVRSDRRGQGIGRALVADLEEQVRGRGGLTIMLGTDDERTQTSVSGIDLYPDPLLSLQAIQNLRGHPYGFYQRCGYAFIGIIPDANGFGKPDLLMAKRVGQGG